MLREILCHITWKFQSNFMFYLTLTARQVNMYKVIYFAVSLIFILAALPQCNARQKHPPKLRTANGTASTSGFPKTPRTDPASDSPSDDATPDQPEEGTTIDYWEGPEEPTNEKTYFDESKTSNNPSKRPSSPSTTRPLPTHRRPAQPTAQVLDNYPQKTTIPRSHRQKMVRRHRLRYQQELEKLRQKIQSQENSPQTPKLTDLEASRASSVQMETSQTNDYVKDIRAHWPTVMCFGLSLLILIPLHLFISSGSLTRLCQDCCKNRRTPATEPVFYRTISVPQPPAHTPYVPPQRTAHDPITDRQGADEARGSLANDHFMDNSARAQQAYQQQVIQQQQTKLAQLEAANRRLRNQVAVETCKLKSQYQQAEDSRPLLAQQEPDYAYNSTARLNDALDLETCRARAASSAFNRNTRGYASLPPAKRFKANQQTKQNNQEVELVELTAIPEEIYQNPGVQLSPPNTVAYTQQQD